MAENLEPNDQYGVIPATYDWSVRIFRTVKKLLSVNFKLHAERSQLEACDILLFNHFSRFETFIPQYLIYEETKSYCCSVASGEFFRGDEVLANFLRNVGAIPHDHPQLLSILAKQILHGNKVIIFPEGGMVKDRCVVDKQGHYSIYSRIAMQRRKQHSGAAVLALTLNIFKLAIRHAYYAADRDKLERWMHELNFSGLDEMLQVALRPTLIAPCNITFYPMRINDNVLRRGAELINQDGITRRHLEELLIEGNILFKETDMDIRLGDTLQPDQLWTPADRKFIANVAAHIQSLDELFSYHQEAVVGWKKHLLDNRLRKKSEILRDTYMHRMYAIVTVNLSHLASCIMMHCIEHGQLEIAADRLHRWLYLCVKLIQQDTAIHLHRSLLNPQGYGDLIDGKCSGLQEFLTMAESCDLIEPGNDSYRFLPKLLEVHDFDEIRIQNPVLVYANEVAPLPAVTRVVQQALQDLGTLDARALAAAYFDDELVGWRWDKAYFSKPCFDDLNKQETATQDPRPFLLHPAQPNGSGVVLIHGLFASPAEVRGFGERLALNGYTVIGPRLRGHGTSPCELRELKWEQWLQSVYRAYRIIEPYSERIYLIGFSTGGALALKLAADQPDKLSGIAAISVPIKFSDSTMMFVPLVHGTNTLMRWFSSYEGKSFVTNQSEHPDINYCNMPVRALYELRRLIDDLENRLADIATPTLILQADKDPVVDAKSADIIHAKLGTELKKREFIAADRHGILYENIGDTQEKIIEFLSYGLAEKRPVAV